jgi:hypothetical protein
MDIQLAARSAEKARDLDKFYTSQKVVELSIGRTREFLKMIGKSFSDFTVIEPSAGAGAFMKGLSRQPCRRIVGYEIEPDAVGITKQDFLALDARSVPDSRDRTMIVGNPPFGKRGSLALGFLNKSFEVASIVVFIVPVLFRKWSTQRRISPDAKLIGDFDLPENAFVFNGKEYDVRCCLQIWTTIDPARHGLHDIRLKGPLPVKHPDFDCYQYNATKEAEKYLDYDWDFAVLSQGYS